MKNLTAMTEQGTFHQPYATLPQHFYTVVQPEPLQSGELILTNERLRQQLQLPVDDKRLKALACGEAGLPNCEPLAQKYTGHQFGFYNPQLGDGRGVLLGEWVDPQGAAWDLHLKGAGRTPYSRQGDGRSVLRSSIREFLVSEALAGLGIPSTRALALACSNEVVYREQVEPRATLIRVAKTHIRFGHFQWAASQGEADFKQLLSYVVQHHFPDWQNLPVAQQAQKVLTAICRATGEMIAHWQAVGFNHGVMNTDNMSILGETFDFGPFAFLDDFQLDFVCNLSDSYGRYAFNEQPKVGLWNCQILAKSFHALLGESEQDLAVDAYIQAYNQHYLRLMRQKLGWTVAAEADKAEVDAQDKQLIAELLKRLDQSRVDGLNFWLKLQAWAEAPSEKHRLDLESLFSQPKLIQPWLQAYQERLQQGADIVQMKRVNPQFILRNSIAHSVISAAEQGDFAPLKQWLEILQSPFIERPEMASAQAAPERTQRGIRLSCSS
ncbi:protein adenylyltransferase SelO [Galenea microaerophila]